MRAALALAAVGLGGSGLLVPAAAARHATPAPVIAQVPLLAPEHHPHPASVSPRLFHHLDELARLADVAYCVPFSGIYPPFSCASRCRDFPTFELIQAFTASPVPLLDSSATGYLAYDHQAASPRLVVAFRGTYSLGDAISDLATTPQAYVPYDGDDHGRASTHSPQCPNCTVHAGFFEAFRVTREKILPAITRALEQHPTYRLTIVGHSLGGAIALLLALEMRAKGVTDLSVTTFGQPAVGNAAFAHHVEDQLAGRGPDDLPVYCRVTHKGDLVPSLPWESWGYAQPALELLIDKSSLPVTEFDIVQCGNGRDDARCPATGQQPLDLWPWDYVAAHRDYFYRLGLCIKSAALPLSLFSF